MDPGPGWFPDPWGHAPLRWWDGAQWSAYTSGAAFAPLVGAGYGVDDRRRESRLAGPARWAVAAWAALTLVQSEATIHTLRTFHDQLQTALDQPGSAAHFSAMSPAVSLLGLVGLVAAGVFLTWQYRAARVARSLGYPARVSPALGVWSWIIPFGSLWLPYQALVDCLPPGHPARGRCRQAWLCFLGYTAAAVIFVLVGILGGSPGPVLVLAALLLVAAVGLGWGCVAAIEADHARAGAGW